MSEPSLSELLRDIAEVQAALYGDGDRRHPGGLLVSPPQHVYEVGRPTPRRVEEAAWTGPEAPPVSNRKQRRADKAKARRSVS